MFAEKYPPMTVDSKSFLVRGLIENFEHKGFEVLYANYDRFKKPKKIMNYQPDVIAWDSENEMYHLGAATNSDEIKQSRADSKLDTLANMSMAAGRSRNSRVPLYLAVPFESSKKISDLIIKSNLPDENIIPLGVGLK